MKKTIEMADYVPGDNLRAPGSGSEGDDPLGLRYANYGPLAFALNEAVDATLVRGADRASLIEQIAQAAGDEVSEQDVEAVLSDKLKCPPEELMNAFANILNIDGSILLDAAQKGGCKGFGLPRLPPGY